MTLDVVGTASPYRSGERAAAVPVQQRRGVTELFDTKPGTSFGVGPQITVPTATSHETGTGKWQGVYARSTGVMVFDLKNGTYAVPVGFGIGKVVPTKSAVFNVFVEPQFTVLSHGARQPELQVFVGLNTQFLKSSSPVVVGGKMP